MKRIVSFVMAAGMALSLAACGGAVSGASSTSTVAPVASSAAAADDGEILKRLPAGHHRQHLRLGVCPSRRAHRPPSMKSTPTAASTAKRS